MVGPSRFGGEPDVIEVLVCVGVSSRWRKILLTTEANFALTMILKPNMKGDWGGTGNLHTQAVHQSLSDELMGPDVMSQQSRQGDSLLTIL